MRAGPHAHLAARRRTAGPRWDAGHADGFDITLHSIATPEYQASAQVVAEQLKAININVEVISEEIGSFAKRVGDGDYDWCNTGRGMRNDPTAFVVDFGAPDKGTAAKWFPAWKNDELVAAYEEALNNLDSDIRHAAIRKCQELTLEECPHIYMVQPYWYHVVQNHVKDMYASFTNFFPGLREVWLDK